jgi:hypothetical protein
MVERGSVRAPIAFCLARSSDHNSSIHKVLVPHGRLATLFPSLISFVPGIWNSETRFRLHFFYSPPLVHSLPFSILLSGRFITTCCGSRAHLGSLVCLETTMSLQNTMPQGSKRKYTSYREPSDPMAPRAETTTGRVVVPTVETQELYNKWRRAHDEGLNEESLRQVQNMHSSHLQPPSPSRATSSRSPSNASTTYSVSHAMGEMDVGDQKSQTGKKKPGRRGPLNPIKQLRANLMRKIGACSECRDRRVSVRVPQSTTPFTFTVTDRLQVQKPSYIDPLRTSVRGCQAKERHTHQ